MKVLLTHSLGVGLELSLLMTEDGDLVRELTFPNPKKWST